MRTALQNLLVRARWMRRDSSSEESSNGTIDSPTVRTLEQRRPLAADIVGLELLDDTGDPGDFVTADPTALITIDGEFSSNTVKLEVDHDGSGTATTVLDVNGAGPMIYDPRSVDPAFASTSGEVILWFRAVEYDNQQNEVNSTSWVPLVFTVQSDNAAPSVENVNVETPFGTAIVIDLLAGATDPDNDTLAVTAIGNAEHGTVSANADGTFTYTPDSGFSGEDGFEFTVSDGQGNSITRTAIIAVFENNAPIAEDDYGEGAFGQAIEVNVITNDVDPENASSSPEEVLEITDWSDGENGVVTRSGNLLIYTPNSGFYGDDSFWYEVMDENGAVTRATTSVRVNAPAPSITDFGGIEGPGNIWTFTGRVSSSNPQGLTVYFGGVIEGRSTQVDENGEFTLVVFDLPFSVGGTISAYYIDTNEIQSSTAYSYISSTEH